MMEENEIFISSWKPAINYVLAAQTIASKGIANITIKARGNNINKAVDVAEITVNRFLTSYIVASTNIGTNIFELEDNKKRNVSTIEIYLSVKNGSKISKIE